MRPAATLCCLLALATAPSIAALPDGRPEPEITRAAAAPQAVGKVHTLRQIPEACARIEGAFTGDPAQPYRHAAVRTSERCQARARFVDAAKARPSVAEGWVLNERLRVPRAGCTAQEAVLTVWRRPAGEAPERDGQGQLRIYADKATQAASGPRALPAMYAVEVAVEGDDCR